MNPEEENLINVNNEPPPGETKDWKELTAFDPSAFDLTYAKPMSAYREEVDEQFDKEEEAQIQRFKRADFFASKANSTPDVTMFSGQEEFDLYKTWKSGGSIEPKLTLEEDVKDKVQLLDLDIDPDKTNLYYNQKSDNTFVRKYYNASELNSLGVNVSDFQGWLSKNGFVDEFRKDVEGGVFKAGSGVGIGADARATGQDNLDVAKERVLDTRLSQYMDSVNKKLDAKAFHQDYTENPEKYKEFKSFKDAYESYEIENGQSTLFDYEKLDSYREKQFANLSWRTKQIIKDQLEFSKEREDQSDARGFFEGAAELVKETGVGFLDAADETATWLQDKIGVFGFDEVAKQKRYAKMEQEALDPQKNLQYLRVSGKSLKYNGKTYLKDSEGRLYDTDNNLAVGQTISEKEKSKISSLIDINGVEDSDYSTRGFTNVAGNVIGNIAFQVLGTKGIGAARLATSARYISGVNKLRAARGLAPMTTRATSKIGFVSTKGTFGKKLPFDARTVDASVFQTMYGAITGYENTITAAKQAGLSDEVAEKLANRAQLEMGILYGLTGPINPRIPMLNKLDDWLVNSKAINEAISNFSSTGSQKAFSKSLSGSVSKLLPSAAKTKAFFSEGLKETVQENIQQAGEVFLVNEDINREAGFELLEANYSMDDFISTSILSMSTAGLLAGFSTPGFKQSPKSRLTNLYELSKNPKKTKKLLDFAVKKGKITQDDAVKILEQAEAVGKYPAPKWMLNHSQEYIDAALIQQKIDKLESQKKPLKNNKTFSENVDNQINKLKQEQDNILMPLKKGQIKKDVETVASETAKIEGVEGETIVLETDEDFKKYNIDPTQSDNAFFTAKDGNIYVNLNKAAREADISAPSHELLHKIVSSQFKAKDGKLDPKMDKVINEFKQVLQSKGVFDIVNNRLQGYRNEKTRLEEQAKKEGWTDAELRKQTSGLDVDGVDSDEWLTQFFKLTAEGNINFSDLNESTWLDLGKKILNFVKSKLNISPKKLEFTSGKQVFDFIVDYEKGISKGKLTEEAKAGLRQFEKTQTKETEEKVDEASQKKSLSLLEDINKLVPKNVKTKEEFLDRKVFNAVFQSTQKGVEPKNKLEETNVGSFLAKKDPSILKTIGSAKPNEQILKVVKSLIKDESSTVLTPQEIDRAIDLVDKDIAEIKNGAIYNYIMSREASSEEKNIMLDRVRERLINYDPAAVRKTKSGQPITFGEFLFANTAFSQRDAKKKLAIDSERQAESLDTEEARQVAEPVAETTTTEDSRVEYQNLVEASVLPTEMVTKMKEKMLLVTKTLKSRIDAAVSKNKTVTPLMSEIKKEMGVQADILFKSLLGSKRNDELKNNFLKLKKPILENMTTTWLMGKDKSGQVQGGMPFAIEKSVNGKFTPDWQGKKIDRETVKTDKAGRTDGKPIVRRLPNAANKIGDPQFLTYMFDSNGDVVRGAKESLSKALAQEYAIDIYNKELKDPNSEIRKAFVDNQQMLGAVLMDNFAQEFSRQAERGSVKRSIPTLYEADQKNPGIITDFTKEISTTEFAGYVKTNNGNLGLATSQYFKKYPIEGLSTKAINDIAREINDNDFARMYNDYARTEGEKNAADRLIELIIDDIDNPRGYTKRDPSIFIKAGLGEMGIDARNLDQINKGRTVIPYLVNNMNYDDFVKYVLPGLMDPGGMGGFKIKNTPSGVIVQEGEVFAQKVPRSALIANKADREKNYNIIDTKGKVKSKNQYSKNWFFDEKFWKLTFKEQIKFVKNLYKEGLKEQKVFLDLLDTLIKGINSGDVSVEGASVLLVNQFRSMQGIGKSMAAPRHLVTDGKKILSMDDMFKLGLAYENDKGVLEHMITAKKMASASLNYLTTQDTKYLKKVKELMKEYNTAVIPKKIDDGFAKKGTKDKMGLFYKDGDKPSETRYKDTGLMFYDTATDEFVGDMFTPSNQEVVQKNKNIDKAFNNASKRSYSENPKGISVYDFDDTLAFSKSGVRYTIPNNSSKSAPQRKAILLMGPSGAGKTTIVDKLGLRNKGFKYVNQDVALDWLTKNSGLPKNMNEFTREQAQKWRELQYEAAGAAKEKASMLRGKGDGVIIDSTGGDIRKVSREFKDAGYDVQVIFVNTSLENALARNKARGERRLSDTVVKNSWEKVQKSIKGTKELVDVFPKSVKEFVEINTDNIKQGESLPFEFINKVKSFTDGYVKGRINAEQFAAYGETLLAAGAEFDFSEFNKVVEGEPGPLIPRIQKAIDKFGNKNIFILTARPVAAESAIHTFMKGLGIDIPRTNITGLANSTAQAKADWMVGKVAEGFNDFYFVDDAIKNVKAVKDVLETFDVKSKVQQAIANRKRSMSSDLNEMIERNTGVRAETTYSKVLARKKGAKKGKFKFFVPYSAEDFKGLTSYTLAGKGKQGEADQRFFDRNLILPYTRGIAAMEGATQALKNDYKNLLKMFGLKKQLPKKIGGTDFTTDQAIRVYLWDQQGFDIPNISKRDQNKLSKLVAKDPDLVGFSEGLMAVSKKDNWVKPKEHWDVGSILKDLNDITDNVNRKEYLAEFIENVDEMFDQTTLNKLEAIYGTNYVEALQDSIRRMKSGSNAPRSAGKIEQKWLNWVNNSVGTIMFFNRRSALLQMLSFTNFINWSDNNPAKAAAAFANQPLYWKKWVEIFNSDKLKERRGGLKSDIQESEIANQARNSKDKASAVISYLLKIGFTPTQIADSFAIATGGATFLINRTKKYEKQGLSKKEAEAKAFEDFGRISDETQQSGDPMLISQQQSSHLGRLILAFQNTPMQYTRLMKKAGKDIINRRGSDVENLSKIAYYGFVQNLIFSSLQSALFALIPGFDDEEEDDAKLEDKAIRTANSMVDTILRGSGLAGAVISTLKNAIMRYQKEDKKGYTADHTYTMLELANVSPPIGSKLRKVYSAIQTKKFNKEVIDYMGMHVKLDGRLNPSPNYEIIANVSSAIANIPADRLLSEIKSINEAFDSRNTSYQRLALALGWRTWDVNVKNEEQDLIKTYFKQQKKELGKKKAAEKRKAKKQEEINKLKAMTPKQLEQYKRDKYTKKKQAARKAAETRRKNKFGG